MADSGARSAADAIRDAVDEGIEVIEGVVSEIFDFSRLIANIMPSPPDPRDWIAEHHYLALDVEKPPPTLDLRSNMPRIRNQGSRSTCAAFSATGIKEYQERLDCGYKRHMSPEYIYFYRSNKPKDGMFSRDLMSILLKRGCCTEQTFPYNKFNDAGSVPTKAAEEAIHYKIKGYAKVTTADGLKTALFNDGPCLVAFPVYDNMPEFWKGKPGQQRVGGHAVICVGYDKTGFIIRNSWGPIWNGDGCVIYKYGDFGAHWEIYTTFDVKGSPNPDDLNPDPNPPGPKPDDGGSCKCIAS